MALRAQVLFHRQRLIQTLRLEHHSDLAPHRGAVAHHVAATHQRPPLAWRHHGGKNAEEGGFAAAIRPQQAEDFAPVHGEADVV